MGDELVILVMDDQRVFCPECAEEEFGEDYPNDATPVFKSDNWKHEVAGLCASCEVFVDGGA